MMSAISRTSAAALAALLLSGCHGSSARAPAPLPQVDLPAGALLKPWDPAKPSQSWPQAMVAVHGNVFIALGNLSATDAFLPPAGPGLLVSLVPSTGAMVVMDLGGADGHQCVNPFTLATDGAKVYAGCIGAFDGTDSGKGIAEVDALENRVLRFLAAPSGFVPSALAVVGGRLWAGDIGSDRMLAVDRNSFTISREPQSLNCPGGSFPATMSAAIAVGNDVFALCSSSDGRIVRIDGATGAVRGDTQVVGAYPVALVRAGDGRIAVANPLSASVSLVTVTGSGMTVQKDLVVLPGGGDLEDVRALDQFLYLADAASKTVTKVDISAAQPKIVDEVNVNPAGNARSNPAKVELLDADQVVVADSGLGRIIGVQFGRKK